MKPNNLIYKDTDSLIYYEDFLFHEQLLKFTFFHVIDREILNFFLWPFVKVTNTFQHHIGKICYVILPLFVKIGCVFSQSFDKICNTFHWLITKICIYWQSFHENSCFFFQWSLDEIHDQLQKFADISLFLSVIVYWQLLLTVMFFPVIDWWHS